jgi:hypothetical protein
MLWFAAAPAANVADLREGAPERYTVVKGDTLWAISGRFLKSPWRWPELWQMNRAQIKNPHWIYPGNVLVLVRSGGEVHLEVEAALTTEKLTPQVRASELGPQPIPAIPTADIEPFLSKPLVIAPDVLKSAPHIIATPEGRVALGAGDRAYVQGVSPDQGTHWYIYGAGAPLVDPDTHETLGNEAVYLGEAQITKFGTPSTAEIVTSALEVTTGSYLLPASHDIAFENYVPHAPDKPVNARIITAYGGLYEVGIDAIVTLNKGARDGLEAGNVLAIYRDLNAANTSLRAAPVFGRSNLYSERLPAGSKDYPDAGTGGMGAAGVILPDDRYGLLMVFRVFDRASYALVMNADRPVHLLDKASNP